MLQLSNIRREFCRSLEWAVGDGNLIQFWVDDSFTGVGLLIQQVASPPLGFENVLVMDMVTAFHEWDLERMAEVLSAEIWDRIATVPLPGRINSLGEVFRSNDV